MELEELKKSWNLLDKRLQQAPLTDEKQIARLVAACQRRTRSSMGRLKSLQRFSLLAGMPIVIALFAFIGLSLPASDEGHGTKLAVLIAFGAVSIALGAWWDWRTYKWIRNIRVDEMPIAEVSRRMTHFRQWADIEVDGGLQRTLLLAERLVSDARPGPGHRDRLLGGTGRHRHLPVLQKAGLFAHRQHTERH